MCACDESVLKIIKKKFVVLRGNFRRKNFPVALLLSVLFYAGSLGVGEVEGE